METPKDFLGWFSVPRYKNVYVLGSFGEHVTLFSQQVRALNLIAAGKRTLRLKMLRSKDEQCFGNIACGFRF
jgi:hypothetical protein